LAGAIINGFDFGFPQSAFVFFQWFCRFQAELTPPESSSLSDLTYYGTSVPYRPGVNLPPLTPQEFIVKWQRANLSERSAAQKHFLDLCDLLGRPKPAAASCFLCPRGHLIKIAQMLLVLYFDPSRNSQS
jgi:hypothetical protein